MTSMGNKNTNPLAGKEKKDCNPLKSTQKLEGEKQKLNMEQVFFTHGGRTTQEC